MTRAQVDSFRRLPTTAASPAPGDGRNHHPHLLATTRAVVGQGMGEKVSIELSDAKRLSLGLGQGRGEIEAVRALWAEHANAALERQGAEARIDPRSLAAQREEASTAGDVIRAAVLDRMPEIKLGWQATELERRGIPTERGDQLRAIREENTLRRRLQAGIERFEQAARQAVRHSAQAVVQRVEEVRKRLGFPAREREEPKGQAPPAPMADELARQLEQFRTLGRQGRAERAGKLERAKPQPEVAPEPQQDLEREQVRKEKQIEREDYGFSR